MRAASPNTQTQPEAPRGHPVSVRGAERRYKTRIEPNDPTLPEATSGLSSGCRGAGTLESVPPPGTQTH
jgi:hypothetical protein